MVPAPRLPLRQLLATRVTSKAQPNALLPPKLLSTPKVRNNALDMYSEHSIHHGVSQLSPACLLPTL